MMMMMILKLQFFVVVDVVVVVQQLDGDNHTRMDACLVPHPKRDKCAYRRQSDDVAAAVVVKMKSDSYPQQKHCHHFHFHHPSTEVQHHEIHATFPAQPVVVVVVANTMCPGRCRSTVFAIVFLVKWPLTGEHSCFP
jgi:hypothetical protein